MCCENKTSRTGNARAREIAARAEKQPSSSTTSSSPSSSPSQPLPTSTLSAAELDARLDVARSTGRLDLSECGLTCVPDAVAILGSSGLEDLSLAGNPRLEALPEWLGEALPRLSRLQAAGCGLRELPESIIKMRELRGLWVHGCRLERLPREIGDLGGSLRSLSLAGNRLRELPSSIGQLSSLVEAGLAGNRLRRLPVEFGGMTSLKKLQLHGNLLGLGEEEDERDDDDEDGENNDAALVAAALAALPEEALAPLRSLSHVTLQSNLLSQLPECLGELPLLEDLNVADNRLLSLPRSLAGAPSLRRLVGYGNRLRSLPPLLGWAPSLRGLWLEGNPLCHEGDDDATEEEGGGSDNNNNGGDACSLASGRQLHALLVDASRASASTSNGNGSSGNGSGSGNDESSSSSSSSSSGGGAEADAASAEGAEGARRRRVGLDARQLASLEPAVVAAAAAGKVLAPPCATLCESKRGYWKLEAGPGGREWVCEVAERVSRRRSRERRLPESSASSPPEVADGSGARGRRGLVVAFGSAPGEPNWGGLLSRLRRNAADSAHARFDVLYVVDGARSWYNGGDDNDDDEKEKSGSSSGSSFWTETIAAAAEAYGGAVLLLGDSMGATGALLAAGAVAEACLLRKSEKRSGAAAAASASSSSSSCPSPLPAARPRALAFCPQVDLAASSIRPAQSEAWMARLRRRAVASVAAATRVSEAAAKAEPEPRSSSAATLPPPATMRVDVHVGSWQHDLAQALPLQAEAGATVKVWGVPSHRLAAALDARGELEPLVRSALLSVMGFSAGRGVRISNVL